MSAFDWTFSGTGPLILFIAKATLLLVAALVATASLRRSTAGARHLVWLAALVGVLALPVLSRIPSLKLGVLPSTLAGPTPAALSVMPAPAVAADPPSPSAPVRSSVAVAAPVAGISAPAIAAAPALAHPVAVGVADGVSGGVSGFLPALSTSGYSILSTLAIAWAFVALVLVGWLVAGAVYVRGIVAGARELTSPDWTTPLCEVADRLDLDVPPRVVLSDRIEMAFACRALAPTIVLPANAEQWTDDRRRAVLFHELAHIKRHDLLGHTLGRLACALYWFHPLVWTAAKRLRAESERACDDLVLSCGARPSEYAQHLLDMVTSVRKQGAPIMALPMARKREFEGRMLAILDPAIRRASPGRLQAATVIATLGVLSLTVAAVAPAAATPVVAPASRVAAVVPEPPASEPPSLSQSPSPSPSAVRSSSSPPSPSASPPRSQSTGAANGPGIQVHTGNSVLDAFVSQTANAVVKSVVPAFQQAGAELARQGRMPAVDTGRVGLMIKILASDSDATVRRTAAWGLRDAESSDVRAALSTALKKDSDARVRETAAWALGEQGDASVSPALADALLHDKSAHVRATSAWALGEMNAKSDVSALESGMADADTQVRQTSIWALGQLDLRSAPKLLTNALTDNSKEVRLVAAWALGEIEDKATAPAILAAFKTETDQQVRSAEMRALAVMGEASTEMMETALKSPDPEVRRRAVAMLAGGSSVEPWPWPWPQPRPSP